MGNTIYEKRTPDMSTWKGRQKKGFRCNNSFQEFVDEAKRTKASQAFNKAYQQRTAFMTEDRTGFVWLYLRK